MKRVFIILMVLMIGVCVYAGDKKIEEQKADILEKNVEQCPVTLRTSDCMTCHLSPWMHVDDGSKYAALKFPENLKVIVDILNENKEVFYYLCDWVDPENMEDVFSFMGQHQDISSILVIEVHNPGGSAFDAWRQINLIETYKKVYRIETRLYGMAFSAGFLLYNVGEPRRIAPSAQLMWHEAAYMEMFSAISKSTMKEKYDMMSSIQDSANQWLAAKTHGKMTAKEIDEKAGSLIGWWFNGKEAFEHGFGDILME